MLRIRARSRLVLGLAIVTSLTLLVLTIGAESGPTRTLRIAVQDVSSGIDNDVSRFIPFRTSQEEAKRNSTSMQHQLSEARAKAATAENLERKVGELQALLQYTPPGNLGKLGARVVASGSSSYKTTIEIDRGHDGGVAVGNPIVAPTGLVGRVIQTSSNRSTVLLLSDTSSNVGVRLSSGEIAVAVGEGVTPSFRSKPGRLEYVDANAQVNAGDTLVTSGLSRSLFPPDLPVGVVAKADVPSRSTRKVVTVDFFVNPSLLDNVVVLQWKP